jgi:hypothetical protein
MADEGKTPEVIEVVKPAAQVVRPDKVVEMPSTLDTSAEQMGVDKPKHRWVKWLIGTIVVLGILGALAWKLNGILLCTTGCTPHQ